MNQIRYFFNKAWNDPVWSNVIALAIFGIFSTVVVYINSLLRQISFLESANKIKSFLAFKVNLPLWIILVFCFAIIYYVVLHYLSSKKRPIKTLELDIRKDVAKDVTKENIINLDNVERIIINDDKPVQISNKFLEFDKGIFSIWVKVTDFHNRLQLQKRNLYIVGYATNSGVSLRNPKLADYPNAWAILRITATENNNLGTWRFWCNDIRLESTHLDFKEPVSGGWHLFTIAWSKNNDYIKFLIDSEIVSEGSFKNWPTDFSGNMMVGTWSNKATVHNFESKLGPVFITNSEFNENLIKSIIKKRQ